MSESETPITIWSALVVQGALDVLLARFRQATALHTDASFDPTTVLMRRIASEPAPDLVIMTTEAMLECPPGFVDAKAITGLVRSGIGLGVVAGASQPPVTTVEDLVDTLLAARSVAYSRSGQSGIYFASLLDRLGIADRVNATATVIEKGFTGEAVVDGRADLAVQQLSELRFVPGISVVGPLPEPVQHYTDFAVALTAAAHHPSASALRDFLVSPDADTVYLREGLAVAPTRR